MKQKRPKRVSISDVAQKAGVSKAAVSMAFRHNPGISIETRKRILDVARQLKYTPFQGYNSKGEVFLGQIGFVIISKDNPPLRADFPLGYFDHMFNGAVVCAEKQGRSVLGSHLVWEQIDSGNLPMILTRQQVDGFIFRAWLSPSVKKLIAGIDSPIVFVDCDQYVEGFPSVQVDNIRAMELIVDHLLQKGVKSFATIAGDMSHINARERLAGLQVALAARNIPLPENAIAIEKNFDELAGRQGVEKLLASGQKFDAIVCHCDLMSYGVIEYLASKNIKVPQDVKVTGFDNMDFSSKLNIPLTTIDTNSFNIGCLGTQLLLDFMENREKGNIHIRSEVSLVIRESTG